MSVGYSSGEGKGGAEQNMLFCMVLSNARQQNVLSKAEYPCTTRERILLLGALLFIFVQLSLSSLDRKTIIVQSMLRHVQELSSFNNVVVLVLLATGIYLVFGKGAGLLHEHVFVIVGLNKIRKGTAEKL